MQNLFEKEYFNEMYEGDYDKRNPKYKFESYFNEIKPFINLSSAVSLLDIGCAYGSFLQVAKNHCMVSGSDISEYAVSIARQRLPGISIVHSDILGLKYEKQFDVITCFDILEHVSEIENAFSHLKTLLTDEGILVITVPVYDTIIGKIVMKLDKDPTHVHKHSRYWWLDTLIKNDFRIIHWTGIWRYYFKNLFYLHYCSRLTRSFTPAIMIICRKKQ
jgi:2-polyprenyl-3-methyl-5-hydroxy-6-metoxy-1,4-benzoquinol methylase